MRREGRVLRWMLLLFVVADVGVFLGRGVTGRSTAGVGTVLFGALLGLLGVALCLGLLRGRRT